ncbi:MAG: recombination protein RecR [Clostridia bacterium]|nr:recombination protein RecR [Clostridia bacterium]
MNQIEPIARLINEFSKLPSVGKRTAERYAYHIIRASDESVKNFAESLLNIKEKIKFCDVCGNYTEQTPCAFCRERDKKIICVVKEPKDSIAIEKTGNFKGQYHILHGVINPLAGVGPNDIRIKELLTRLDDGITQEVIIATNPDVEGEATALYISRLLKPLGIKVSRIAQGISMGSELEYADEVTLSKALLDRKEI